MTKRTNLTIAILTVLLLVFASASLVLADDGLKASAGEGGAIPHTEGGLLYDQTDNASGNGAPDQDFEAAFNIYDAEGADDFVIPTGDTWLVDRVVTVGTQSAGGTPASVDVAFYPDDAGFPGATAACTYTALSTAAPASLDVTLDTPCVLTEGKWWVAIQANQDFNGGVGGQHFWSNRTSTSNDGGVWRNPGDGFGTGCTDWDRQTTCGVGGGTNPDFLFQIFGTVFVPTDVSLSSFTGQGTSAITVWVTVFLIGLVGAAVFVRRRYNH
jgi:hypothetical protein